MPFVIGEVEVTNEVSLAPSAVLYDGAVVADGDLTVKVNNFYYDMGGTKGKYLGSSSNAVTDDAVNYVYLATNGSLVINTSGYVTGLNIRLARVVASGGFITRVILERAFLTASVDVSGNVQSSRKVDTENGLQGGGDLTQDRTLSPVYGTTTNTVCEGDDSRLTEDKIASGLRTTSTVVSISGSSEPTAGQTLIATDGVTAAWASIVAGSDGWIQFNDNGLHGASSVFVFDKTTQTLILGPATVYPNNPLNVASNIDSYTQVTFQNKNAGTSASTDLVLTADNGDDESVYLDIGINGSNYDEPDWNVTSANDGYIIGFDGNLVIGTGTEAKVIKLFTGGTIAENLRATIDDSGIDLVAGLTYRVDGTALPFLTDSDPEDVTKDTAAVGVATDAARADHKHDVSTGTAGAVALGDTAAEGIATSLARSDHQHSVAAGTPVDVSTSNSEGVATTFARSDHAHNVPFGPVQTALGAADGDVSFNDQDLTDVGTINGVRDFGTSATDPSSPTPVGGDHYYNTTVNASMYYDGARSKWLGAASPPIYAGASGLTAAGSYFRGMDGLAFGSNRGIPVQKGTLVALMVSMTTSATSEVEVLVDSSVIASLPVTTVGITADLTLNADFSQGLMKFRNKSTGATMTNVQITAQMKRRV